MDKGFARLLIQHPKSDLIDPIFAGEVKGAFLVDWREADDDIIKFASKALGGNASQLQPQWIDDKLHINFRGSLTKVALKNEPGNQDLTLLALNKAISPEFEIRYIKPSEGGDTIGFLVLPAGDWAALESAFGRKARAVFPRIRKSAPLFSDKSDPAGPSQAEVMASHLFQIRFLKFTHAAFRVQHARFANQFRDVQDVSAGDMPVIEPLFGDLVLTYFRNMLNSDTTITVGMIQEYGLTLTELRELALGNARKSFKGMSVSKVGKLEELICGKNVASWTILAPNFWHDIELQQSQPNNYLFLLRIIKAPLAPTPHVHALMQRHDRRA